VVTVTASPKVDPVRNRDESLDDTAPPGAETFVRDGRCAQRTTDDHLYISVDVDVADPAHAPGTGTPEPGGPHTVDVRRVVRRLAAEVGIDVVEVSPPYDAGNNITALFAHRCVIEAITGTAMRRMGLTSPTTSIPGLRASARPGPGPRARKPEEPDANAALFVGQPVLVVVDFQKGADLAAAEVRIEIMPSGSRGPSGSCRWISDPKGAPDLLAARARPTRRRPPPGVTPVRSGRRVELPALLVAGNDQGARDRAG
jgi:hypothetical protein